MENYGAGENLITCLLDFKFWPFLYCFQFKDSFYRSLPSFTQVRIGKSVGPHTAFHFSRTLFGPFYF